MIAATGSVTSSEPFADQDPHRARDDGLRRGEHHVARLDRRVAERAPHRDPAVARQRDLARRQPLRVDVELHPGEQRVERDGIDAEVGGIGDGTAVDTGCRS